MILLLIGGELVERDFSPVITDKQWSELERHCPGLPAEARDELDDYIGFARELRADATKQFGGDFRSDKLSALAHAEQQSKTLLDGLLASDRFFGALATGLDGEVPIPTKELQSIRDWLEHTSACKQQFHDWCTKARAQVHHERTGPQTGRTALSVLVRAINDCVVGYGLAPISTGTQSLEFVTKVCRIAFDDLGDPVRKGQKKSAEEKENKDRAYQRVKKAVEQLMSDTREFEHFGQPSFAWQHLVPGWKRVDRVVAENEHFRVHLETEQPSVEPDADGVIDAGTLHCRTQKKAPGAVMFSRLIYPNELFVPDDQS